MKQVWMVFFLFVFHHLFLKGVLLFVRISIGVNADTMIKRLRKTMVVKINALVGPYKYIPGTWVSLAVTNKKN